MNGYDFSFLQSTPVPYRQSYPMPTSSNSNGTSRTQAAFRRLSDAATRIQTGQSRPRSVVEKRGEGHYVVRQVDTGTASQKGQEKR